MNESSIPIAKGVEKWVKNIHENIVQSDQESVVDYTPYLEMEFESEVAAYEFYNEYSKRIGFGIRREYGNKSKKDGILTSRRFSCFKEGKRSVDKRDHLTKEPRAETRTGCEAHFEACIDLHEEEGEFLTAWNDLLVDHSVSDDSWLHTIFRVKEKWAWAYVRKTFTAGMRSTQLSESFNADLKNHLKSDLNLVQFFTHMERVVNGKRYNESEADYESRHKLPRLKMKKAPMLV
ncbi:FAR1 DNA-binding domain [Sesbania bispinosa]|nr:FAR1 DNA-binding domain [Sesbania bispinosa]